MSPDRRSAPRIEPPAQAHPLDVRSALADAAKRFRAAGVDDAPLEARLLLARALGAEPATPLLEPDRPMTSSEREAFERLLARRLAREPLFYILGEREFYSLPFFVDPRALIPRPETELLVEEALATAAAHPPDASLRIADVGTGSGCIAVALAVHLPHARLYALDISAEALALAQANAARHGVQGRIAFLQGNLLEPLSQPLGMEIIVCNPPYVPTEDLPGLPPEIGRYEPQIALDGGPGGLVTIRRLLAQAPAHLRPGGVLLVEIGYGQGAEALEAARRAFPRAALDLVPDLAGIPRMLRGRTALPFIGSSTSPTVP